MESWLGWREKMDRYIYQYFIWKVNFQWKIPQFVMKYISSNNSGKHQKVNFHFRHFPKQSLKNVNCDNQRKQYFETKFKIQFFALKILLYKRTSHASSSSIIKIKKAEYRKAIKLSHVRRFRCRLTVEPRQLAE